MYVSIESFIHPFIHEYFQGSPADKAELEVADEILEINGKPLNNSSHGEVITHIHNVRISLSL